MVWRLPVNVWFTNLRISIGSLGEHHVYILISLLSILHCFKFESALGNSWVPCGTFQFQASFLNCLASMNFPMRLFCTTLHHVGFCRSWSFLLRWPAPILLPLPNQVCRVFWFRFNMIFWFTVFCVSGNMIGFLEKWVLLLHCYMWLMLSSETRFELNCFRPSFLSLLLKRNRTSWWFNLFSVSQPLRAW